MNGLKIAIIGSRGYPYVYSGYETFVAEIAPRLVREGFEIHVYCHRQLFAKRPEKVNGVYLHYIHTIQSKKLSQWSNSLLCTLHAIFCSYDAILYVNSANGIFGPVTKVFRKKTAINVDGLEWLRPKWKGLGGRVFYFSSKMAVRWMDRIITDAEGMRQVYLKEFERDSSVIAYGANIRYSSRPEMIKNWELEPFQYFLIVGRLIPDNNALLILEEFIQSNSRRRLVIVGDVPYKDEYALKIKSIKDPRIIFTGYVTDQNCLAELYHNCFAYFHGHEFGGTNPTLLKALAYGCAIIAIDTVFSREVLDSDKYGIYFTKEKGMLKEVIELVEGNAACLVEFRKKGRERVKEQYTWEKIADQYASLFKELTNP